MLLRPSYVQLSMFFVLGWFGFAGGTLFRGDKFLRSTYSVLVLIVCCPGTHLALVVLLFQFSHLPCFFVFSPWCKGIYRMKT